MATLKVGILSMGDMGAGIGSMLKAKGIQVATNCQGRRHVAIYLQLNIKLMLC